MLAGADRRPAEKKGFPMRTDGTDGVNDAFIKEFGRHFLSLTCDHWAGRSRETLRRFVISGFLMSLRDHWFLATAGHVINEINELLKSDPGRTYRFGIIDNFGPEARYDHAIPFDYINADTWATAVETSGADFGLIHIDPYYRQLIETNNPLPFMEPQWQYTRHEPFEFHALMGIPAETISTDALQYKQYAMAMIPLKEITTLPPSITPRPYPTLYAEITVPLNSIESIKGMSGCPVFGFAKDENGNWRYWIVAVQSTWYYERKPPIIAASLFKELAADAEAFFDGLVDDAEGAGELTIS
jgi:hypothetical protein